MTDYLMIYDSKHCCTIVVQELRPRPVRRILKGGLPVSTHRKPCPFVYRLLLGMCYRPPPSVSSTAPFGGINALSLKMEVSRYRTILVGDFNVNLLKRDSRWSRDLLQVMSGYGLTQFIFGATVSGALLDLLYSSVGSLPPTSQILPPLSSSDHPVVFSRLCSPKASRQARPTRCVWLYDLADFDAMNEVLSQHLPKIPANGCVDVDASWSAIEHSITSTARECIPSKIIRCGDSHPWITREVRQCLRARSIAHRQAKAKDSKCLWKKFE